MRDGKGRVFVPSPNHRTLWIEYPVKKSAEYPRGRAKENTGIPIASEGSKEWKQAARRLDDHLRAFRNEREGIAVQVTASKKRIEEWGAQVMERIERTCAPNTTRGERSRLKALSKTFGNDKPDEVTASRIGAYQNGRLDEGLTGKAINAEVALLLRILGAARKDRKLAAVPEVEWLPAGTKKRAHVEAPRIAAAIDYLRLTFPRFADFAEAFNLCGLRPKALGRVTAGMVRGIGSAREIEVPKELMKASGKREARPHRLPIFGRFAEIIDARLADPAWDGLLFHDGNGRSLLGGSGKDGLSNAANEAWRAARAKAGLTEGWGFYGLRGCFNTRALNGGASQPDVDAAMSHIRDAVTDAYLLRMGPMVRRAMECAGKEAERESRELAEVVVFALTGT